MKADRYYRMGLLGVIGLAIIVFGMAGFKILTAPATITPPSPQEESAALQAPPTAPVPEIFSDCGFIVTGDFEKVSCANEGGIFVYTSKNTVTGVNWGKTNVGWTHSPGVGVTCISSENLTCTFDKGQFEVRKEGGE